MDSRDSSSSSSMAVTRDGTTAADDKGVLSLTSSLAKEAAILFQSQKYTECVEVLMQLYQKKENDPKVLHNMALAKFFRDGCLDHRELVEVLINVKRRCEDLAHASREQLEAASQPGNKTTAGPKGTNSVGHQNSESGATMIYTDEFDSSVATLNMAIISSSLHDYARALSILKPLFQNIEPVDEGTAIHICLLLLDLAVSTQDVPKLADVINYVEKAFSFGHMNQADNGSLGLQSSNLVMKSSSVPVNASTADDFNSDASATANASETSLSRTLSDETVEYETLLSTLDMGGQNLSRPTNLPNSNDPPRTPSDRMCIDLKLKLPLYKVQLLFLTKNLKMAKRELKLAMNIARGRDSSSALLLKSQLEVARGNYVKAEKLLKACYNQAEVGNSVIYNNNVGCIFYQWGKHNAAGIFFNKALLSCVTLRKEKPRELATFSQDRTLLIMYNSGLQYLACGNPILAAQCFQKSMLVFYKKPFLWLRLAECSLLALEKGLSRTFDRLLCGRDFKVSVIGQGKWRHLAVEVGLMRERHTSSTEREDSTSGSVKRPPNLSLSFARQCLWNALDLVRCFESKSEKSGLPLIASSEENEPNEVALSKNSGDKHSSFGDSKRSKDSLSSSQANANGDIKEQKSGAKANAAAVSSFSEYEDTCRRESLKIKQAILVNLAFVELELGNPQAALSQARCILEMPECSKMCAFLAHVYAAEALCSLNKLKEAAEQLSVYFSGGKIDLPYSEEDYEQWQVNRPSDSEESYAGTGAAKNSATDEGHNIAFYKPEEARAALYVNLSSMSATQGDFEQATRFAVQALSVVPNSREANLMAVYLALKRGRVEEAQVRLRRCSCASFVPWASRSKGSS